jgi:chromosome segregation ATPase
MSQREALTFLNFATSLLEGFDKFTNRFVNLSSCERRFYSYLVAAMLFSGLVKRKQREVDTVKELQKEVKRRKTLARLYANLQLQTERNESMRREYEEKITSYESLLALTRKKHDSDINSKQREIAALQNNIAMFEKQKQFAIGKLQHFNQLQSELQQHKQHVKVLMAENQSMKQSEKASKAKRESLGGQQNKGGWFGSSSGMGGDLVSEKEKAAESRLVLDLQNQIKELTRYTKTLEQSDKRLKQLSMEQSQDLSVKAQALETATDKVNVLQTQNKQDVESIMQHETSNAELRAQVQSLRAAVQSKHEALLQLQSDRTHRTQLEIDQMENYIGSLEAKQSSQKQELVQLRTDMTTAVQSKNAEVARMEHKLQISSDFAALSKQQVAELQAKAAEFEAYIQRLEANVAKKADASQALQSSVASLEAEVQQHTQERDLMYTQHKSEINALQQKLVSVMESKQKSVESATELSSVIGKHEATISELRTSAKMQLNYVEKVRLLQDKIEELKTELLCANQLAKGSSELCAKLEEEKNGLREQLIEAENFMETQHGEVRACVCSERTCALHASILCVV